MIAASTAHADTLRGTILDEKSRAPVAGAIITAGGELAASGDDGTFTLALPAGVYTVEVSAPFLVTKRQRVTLQGELALAIEVAAAEQLGGETIEISDFAPTAPGETRIDAKVARAVPGGGDAAKVVQSLPAVARSSAGSSEIVVWGAAPRDTRVFVDGVPVAALYHVGGYRSAVGNDLVGDIRLTPAAFGPERGRAIGGVIDIGLADPAKAPLWRAQADLLDGSVAGRTKLAGVTIAAAARRSWLDQAIDLITDPRTLAPNAPLPRWSDGQIIARKQLGADLVATGWVLGALDALDRTLVSDDPATQTSQQIDQRTIRAQVTLRRDQPGGFESATLWFGRDRSSDDLQVGLIPAGLRSALWVGGGRAIQQARVSDRATLTLGLDLDGEQAEYTRTGSLAIPAREGDPRIFGQPPGDDVSADRWSATTIDLAGYAAVDLRTGPIIATVGVRGDGWLLGASRKTPRVGTTPGIASQRILFTGDPRAAITARISGELALRVDAGRYHQARAGSDVSAVFGTPALGLEEAWHVTAGGQWQRSRVALEVAAYARWMDTLVARDLALTPKFAQVLTHGGTGRVVGAQVTARIASYHGLTGWLSYALSRSTRKDAAMQPERLFDHDQTHGLIAAGGWERGPWTLGGRVRLSTGEPRTPVIDAFFDSRSGRFQPVRGAHNSVRLPAFFAADLRGERRFTIAAPTRGAIYLEVQNLTNRANPEELIYSADFSQQGYLTSLPLLAIAGVRIER